jgi:hypothetical protein
VIYTVRPIGGIWPGRRTLAVNRKRSPFKAIYTRIISDLARELKLLRAREVVFRLEVSEYGIRQDGQLRSDARIGDPGIIVEFNADKIAGSPRLRYKCDRYKTWQDNLCAIARALEALRLVDRYEVTTAGEQYSGFKALAAGSAAPMTVPDAAEIIARHGSSSVTAAGIASDVAAAKIGVRAALHRTHPDRNEGERLVYDQVDAARRVLSAHHGISL